MQKFLEKVEIIEAIPTVEQYLALRKAVEWHDFDPEIVTSALSRSLFCLIARVNGEFAGMARLVGDGGILFYVQDVAVFPVYQGRGLGTQLMDRVMAYLQVNAPANASISLMATPGAETFYEHYGFIRRPNEKMGAGMILYMGKCINCL